MIQFKIGYKRHLVIRGYDRARLDKINRYQNKIQVFYEKLLDTQNKAEEYIQSIADSRIRRILRFKYFDNYSWLKIALTIGGNATADSIRMEHNRFFDKN